MSIESDEIRPADSSEIYPDQMDSLPSNWASDRQWRNTDQLTRDFSDWCLTERLRLSVMQQQIITEWFRRRGAAHAMDKRGNEYPHPGWGRK